MNDSDIMTASRLRFLLTLRDHPSKAAHSRFKRQKEWALKRGYMAIEETVSADVTLTKGLPKPITRRIRGFKLALTEAGKARMEKEYTA